MQDEERLQDLGGVYITSGGEGMLWLLTQKNTYNNY